MKKLFIALMFALGLAMTPALAGTDTVCDGNFEAFAANAMQDYFVVSGPSADSFALAIAATIGPKPVEITTIVIPVEMDPDGDNSVVFFTFKADNCPYGVGQGYMAIDSVMQGLAAAALTNDGMVTLKANPDAKPAPEGTSL